MFAPPADDPLFGYHSCERCGCPRAGAYDRARTLGLCDQCAKNYLARVAATALAVPLTLEQFKALPMLRLAQADREQRVVPGVPHAGSRAGRAGERAVLGVQPACATIARQTVEEFVAGDARSRRRGRAASFGRCLVDGCRRWATTRRAAVPGLPPTAGASIPPDRAPER